MPPFKKSIQDRLHRLHNHLPSPKKAIKRAAITLSPVKSRLQKKHQDEDPDDRDNHVISPGLTAFTQEQVPSTANCEDDNMFLGPTDHHTSVFHQGSVPEPPTAMPMAFKLFGKFTTGRTSPHCDSDDLASIHTFPTPCTSSISAESDDNNDLENENLPPELDKLCAPEVRAFPGDVYPCLAPPKSFLKKMAAIRTKQILAVAPDITATKAVLLDIELVLRGPSQGASGGYKPPDLSPWVHV
ncbi:hypothetical protein B0H10DRAFT_1945251 [Mycena sp. CBHHK59/15]|nr:hypothetical protein B0H10DRAFT_1945251 [Mycena sp. CBHHK59/15]